MTPATLLAAAAIIDARAAQGHPEWRRIADELTRYAADLAEPPFDADEFRSEGAP